MKIYEITKRDNAKNVFGISLVATPAMESNYIKLSKENTSDLTELEKIELSKEYDVKFAEVNKEKRLLLGLVLEPNKLIYRYDQATKEEYYITVSSETILELQADYAKQSNQNYSTIEHDGRELDGITFTQHWIVEDSNIDKSALYGLKFKKGSWVSIAKIENDTLWNDYIETGNVMGFSIDAMVHLKEVNLNKQKMSETKTILSALTDLKKQISLAFEPKKKAEKKYEDMTPEEKAEYDKKKKEAADKVAMAEAEKVKLAKEEVDKIALLSEEDKKKQIEFEAILKGFKDLGIEFTAVVKDALKPIQDANIELTKEVKTLEAKVIELGEQPASKEIRTNPSQVDFSKMNELQKRQYHRQNG